MLDLFSNQGYFPADTNQVLFHNWLQASLISAAAANFYDWFLTFYDEVWYIWCNRKLPKYMQILFFFMRYTALTIHIGQNIWSSMLLAEYPIPLFTCRLHRAFEIAPPIILSCGADLLLLLRVWALFSRDRKLSYFLAVMYIGQIISIATLVFSHDTQIRADALCITYVPPMIRTSVAVSVIVFQTITWAMTMHRCYFNLKHTWSRNAFAIQLMRDGTCLWLTLCTFYLLGLISPKEISNSLTEMVYPWVNTTMSIATCRMILNLQEMAGTHNLATIVDDTLATPPVQLTTNALLFESQMARTIGGAMTGDVNVEPFARITQSGDEIELQEIRRPRGT